MGQFIKLLVPGIIFLIAGQAIAQQDQFDRSADKPRYMYNWWDNTDGIPSNSLFSITQSEDGYIWFAGEGGLVRFDGSRFTVYNPSNTPEIKDKLFYALAKGRDGTLWAANMGGIVNISEDGFTHINRTRDSTAHKVNSILQGADHKIYLATAGNGLEVMNTKREMTIYQTGDGLSSNTIYDQEFDSDSTLWLGTHNGLNRFSNGDPEPFTKFEQINGREIRTLLADSHNRLWVGTHNNGLFMIEKGNITKYSTENGLSGNMVVELYEDRDGVIWAGTNGNGINRITEGQIAHYTTDDGLPGNTIFSIYQSSDGSYWAATAGLGLTHFSEAKITSVTEDQGLSSNIILPIYQHQNGDIWVGTAGEGLNQIDSEGSIQTYTTDSGLANNLILSIYGEPDGTLWVGTPSGLNKINEDEITQLTSSDGLGFETINAILLDRSETLWIAGPPGNLQFKKDGLFQTFRLPDPFQSAHIVTLFEDSGNNLWAGSMGAGILRISSQDTTHFTVADGLPSDTILEIMEDRNGNIWIGTNNGLGRFKDNKFETFTTADGLRRNEFYRLLEDHQGNLWSCSNDGLQITNIESVELYSQNRTGSIQSYSMTTTDGMPNNECNGAVSPAGWIMQNGEFWFPTVRGVAQVNPDSVGFDTTPPAILIENLNSGNRTYSRNEPISLPPGTSTFEIKYTALEFINPDRIQFRFRLKGFHDTWVDAENRRTAYFTGLPPGRYEFEVQASKAGGEWAETAHPLVFHIEPFFYQTRTFLGVIFILLFFTGFGVERLWRYKTDQQRLQKKVDRRTKELRNEVRQHQKTEQQLEESLAEKTILLKEIHHRVKNNLAVINALFQLQVHKTDNPEALNLLTDSQHRIKSIAMIHEHLYQTELFSSIKMNEYIHNLTENIGDTFADSGRDITMDLDLKPIELSINQAIPCGLILNELITNAYKHAFDNRDQGVISILLSINGDLVTLEVSDNGTGPGKMTNILESETTGMTLVKTLASQLNGNLNTSQNDGMTFTLTFTKEKLDRQTNVHFK